MKFVILTKLVLSIESGISKILKLFSVSPCVSTILRKRGNTNVRVKSTWTQNPVNKDSNSTLLEINVSSYVVVVMIVVIESFRKAKDKTKETFDEGAFPRANLRRPLGYTTWVTVNSLPDEPSTRKQFRVILLSSTTIQFPPPFCH